LSGEKSGRAQKSRRKEIERRWRCLAKLEKTNHSFFKLLSCPSENYYPNPNTATITCE
jgi:hypothetical protein